MKVVIAGSYIQYRNWLRETGTNPRDAIYAESEERLMGLKLSKHEIVFTGEHWKCPISTPFLLSRIRK